MWRRVGRGVTSFPPSLSPLVTAARALPPLPDMEGKKRLAQKRLPYPLSLATSRALPACQLSKWGGEGHRVEEWAWELAEWGGLIFKFELAPKEAELLFSLGESGLTTEPGRGLTDHTPVQTPGTGPLAHQENINNA